MSSILCHKSWAMNHFLKSSLTLTQTCHLLEMLEEGLVKIVRSKGQRAEQIYTADETKSFESHAKGNNHFSYWENCLSLGEENLALLTCATGFCMLRSDTIQWIFYKFKLLCFHSEQTSRNTLAKMRSEESAASRDPRNVGQYGF